MPETYTTKGLPPPPHVSKTTIPIAGLLVDVYGLEEVASDVPLTCLHLLHPRLRTRARMSDIASRVISGYNNNNNNNNNSSSSGSSRRYSKSTRGLIAVAFDMPNHGSRMVSELANETWDKGNERHALDMAGVVAAAGRDMKGLMDLLAGYLEMEVDGHVCLGWSLGGHAAWQGWMREERLDAVVVVVGCPDFMELMSRRAKNSSLSLQDNEPFLGSKYFPPSLVSTCLSHDPRGLLFGRSPPSSAASSETGFDISSPRGKKLLICSGADDKLVPHKVGVPFIEALRARGVDVDERVYEGVGHAFSGAMVQDAVKFLVEAVERGPRREKPKI